MGALSRWNAGTAPSTPVNLGIGETRRYAVIRAENGATRQPDCGENGRAGSLVDEAPSHSLELLDWREVPGQPHEIGMEARSVARILPGIKPSVILDDGVRVDSLSAIVD